MTEEERKEMEAKLENEMNALKEKIEKLEQEGLQYISKVNDYNWQELKIKEAWQERAEDQERVNE